MVSADSPWTLTLTRQGTWDQNCAANPPHTCTYTCVHTRTHPHAHTYTCTRTHLPTHTHTSTCIHTHPSLPCPADCSPNLTLSHPGQAVALQTQQHRLGDLLLPHPLPHPSPLTPPSLFLSTTSSPTHPFTDACMCLWFHKYGKHPGSCPLGADSPEG